MMGQNYKTQAPLGGPGDCWPQTGGPGSAGPRQEGQGPLALSLKYCPMSTLQTKTNPKPKQASHKDIIYNCSLAVGKAYLGGEK